MSVMSAEAVCIGHPDKLCGLIPDTIVDAALETDPTSRAAIEVMATRKNIYVTGEMACPTTLPIRTLARTALTRAGHGPGAFELKVTIANQSTDIASGVVPSWEHRHGAIDQQDIHGEIGAGDQGTAYGYATAATSSRLPLTYVAASQICRALGGPKADTGLTGRKLMVDTYGGLTAHGGGALSGKDGTKVDRSAAYMARLAAKTIVDAGLAPEVTVGLSYAIGVARPVAVTVDTGCTGEVPDDELAEAVKRAWDLLPAALVDTLHLDGRVKLSDTAACGRLTRDYFPGRTPPPGRTAPRGWHAGQGS